MADNIFMKIISGEIPCAKVHEDDRALAFLDIAPAVKGHTLVIPKTHYETLGEVPDDLLAHLYRIAKQIANKMVESLGCDGYNILSNNRPAAGQIVPHVHIHVIPRYENDGAGLVWEPNRAAYKEGEMDEMAGKLKI
ncbi:MAG: HIT family protein [DPANN group archaeon]|nr:HIT family protein [DPANN group archaeon]